MFNLSELTQLIGEDLNKLNNNQKFYKIINESKTHFGFQYEIGLNCDVKPFNPTKTCCAGGLYFTTEEFIHEFCRYGIFISEITIPDDALCCIENNHKIKSNKIVVKDFVLISECKLQTNATFIKKMLQSNSNNLQHIQEQTPEICHAAVSQNGWALQYVKKQTSELCHLFDTFRRN